MTESRLERARRWAHGTAAYKWEPGLCGRGCPFCELASAARAEGWEAGRAASETVAEEHLHGARCEEGVRCQDAIVAAIRALKSEVEK